MTRATKLKRIGTARRRAASSCNAFAIVSFVVVFMLSFSSDLLVVNCRYGLSNCSSLVCVFRDVVCIVVGTVVRERRLLGYFFQSLCHSAGVWLRENQLTTSWCECTMVLCKCLLASCVLNRQTLVSREFTLCYVTAVVKISSTCSSYVDK